MNFLKRAFFALLFLSVLGGAGYLGLQKYKEDQAVAFVNVTTATWSTMVTTAVPAVLEICTPDICSLSEHSMVKMAKSFHEQVKVFRLNPMTETELYLKVLDFMVKSGAVPSAVQAFPFYVALNKAGAPVHAAIGLQGDDTLQRLFESALGKTLTELQIEIQKQPETPVIAPPVVPAPAAAAAPTKSSDPEAPSSKDPVPVHDYTTAPVLSGATKTPQEAPANAIKPALASDGTPSPTGKAPVSYSADR